MTRGKADAVRSLCPVCLRVVQGRYIAKGGNTYLQKNCPEHGDFETLVWEHGTDFESWDAGVIYSRPEKVAAPAQKGCPYDCGLCPKHAQASCCILIEITQRCDQHCPVCFAAAGGADDATDYSLGEMDELLDFLRAQSSEPYNIQLSGGEPTLHPQLPEIIRACRERGFGYVQVNTNGHRLAEDATYAKALRKAGLHTVFLQFDGTRDGIYQKLRGAPLLALKKRAIQNSVDAGLGVILTVTVVPGVNDDNLGDIIDFAAARLPRVRGIHLQPVSYFGRYPAAPKDADRITLPGLISHMVRQTGGRMRPEDFVPLASGHGRCSFHGNFLMLPEGLHALSAQQGKKADHSIEKARAYLARRWGPDRTCATADSLPDTPPAEAAGYDPAEWAALVRQLKRYTLAITAMAFQDAWTADLDRLCRCRLHVATRDKHIIPFCAFNITNAEGQRLHEGTGRR